MGVDFVQGGRFIAGGRCRAAGTPWRAVTCRLCGHVPHAPIAPRCAGLQAMPMHVEHCQAPLPDGGAQRWSSLPTPHAFSGTSHTMTYPAQVRRRVAGGPAARAGQVRVRRRGRLQRGLGARRALRQGHLPLRRRGQVLRCSPCQRIFCAQACSWMTCPPDCCKSRHTLPSDT